MADAPDAVEGERVTLSGSAPAPVAGQAVKALGQDAATTVTVYVRGRAEPPAGERVTREEWASRYGADPDDIAAVEALAAAHRLTVESVDPSRRAVVLAGRLADLGAAFGTSIGSWRDGDGQDHLAQRTPITLPRALGPVIRAVVGLDERPQARTHFRPAEASTSGYSPAAVAAAYDFPAGTDGTGQTVAIVELGGGYRAADLSTYFTSLGIIQPSVTAVAVDGGANSPGAADGPDGEVMLDIEVVGSVAPGARIAVYFAPNTNQGFIDAVSTAVHDTTHAPGAVSISWGGPESTWTAQAANQMEQVMTEAATLGVTVTCAAGDNGSTDGVADGAQHVDFPASAPHALACGGTRLTIGTGGSGAEVVWDDSASGGGATGGGISDLFALPSYQSSARVPPSANPGGRVGRGVPDVAGDADPQTGYRVRVDGQDLVIGGTSAVAPLWAALVARLNQALGRNIGDIHAALYADPGALQDVTTGSNGAYAAGPGWDACTGLGTPNGARLLAALSAAVPPPAATQAPPAATQAPPAATQARPARPAG